MLDPQTQKLMRAEQKAFGIQEGFKLFSPADFDSMDQTSSARQGMKDNSSWWQENFKKTGPFCLRTLWGQGATIYTAPTGKTIVYYMFFNIGITNYAAVFLSDGTAVQVNTATGVTVTISSTPGLFYNGGQLPVAVQWGAQYLLIANNLSPNDYWVWDGTIFYQAGSLSPIITITDAGANYTSQPTIVAFGGNGSGATFTSTIVDGSITDIQITNPGTGYEPGDEPQLYISGGGTDSGIELTANLAAGTVQSVVITNPGTGYTNGTYALGFSGGGGTGAAGTYTVVGGVVSSTAITSGGSGYTSAPSVSFPSGSGSNAAGIATLNAGTVSSVTVVHGGTNLTGTPTLSFVGGGGTGAAATAVVSSGSITSVTVTNGGSGYTSAPAVVAQTGLNNAAAADISLMPFGISGTSMETFQQRVWLGYPNQTGTQQNGGTYNVSAPISFTDFATSDGGVIFTNSDSFLRYQYVNFKQSNGYLYAFGDSSVSVISNVQTSGTPSVTTFNYQNTDPQTGVVWRDTLVPYSRTILFGNPFGVFGLYGGAVTKISKRMDNIFNNAVFPSSGGITPTSAVCNMYASKVFLMNMTVTDPFTQTTRNVMVSWDETDWFISSQVSSLTFVATQEINSNLIAWGTDGTSLFPLFQTPSSLLTKKYSSKLYGQQNFLIQKMSLGFYAQGQDLSPGASGISFSTLTVDTETGSYEIPQLPVFPSGSSSAPPYYPIVSAGSGDIYGCNLGWTLTTMSKDATISFMGIGHVEIGSIGMGSNPIYGTSNTE